MKKKIIKISLFVIFILFIFTSGVVAAKLTAKDIGFTSTNENWNVTNVEDAVNDLYEANSEAKDNNFSAFMMAGITGEKAAPFSYSIDYNGSQYGAFSTSGFSTNNEISFTFRSDYMIKTLDKFKIGESGKVVSVSGERKAIELYGKAGFTAWDLSMFDRNRLNFATNKAYDLNGEVISNDLVKFAKELKKIGLDYGMVCNQSHAPFPSIRPEIRDCFKKAIEMTAEAGGKICVIHPCNNYTPEQNAEMYNEFLPFAKSHGVKIATENMWNWSNEKDEALPAACCDEESFVVNKRISVSEF